MNELRNHLYSAYQVLEKHQQRYAAIRLLESGTKILTGESPQIAPDSASTSNNTMFTMGMQRSFSSSILLCVVSSSDYI